MAGLGALAIAALPGKRLNDPSATRIVGAPVPKHQN
jgi:hypothetical protein